MCGIVGLYAFRNALDASVLERATNALRHRGPDDEGYLIYDSRDRQVRRYRGDDSHRPAPGHIRRAVMLPGSLGLGHRRLAILDPTSAGHQPMSSPDGRLWIVYNGEIYNYRDLRRELESRGHRFHTEGDTEVLLACYAEWGEA